MVENKQKFAENDAFGTRLPRVYHVRINYSKRLREMNCFLRRKAPHKCAVLDRHAACRVSGRRETLLPHPARPAGKILLWVEAEIAL
jgi:hypothetical protein